LARQDEQVEPLVVVVDHYHQHSDYDHSGRSVVLIYSRSRFAHQ
jgi:hypothetical protein